LQHKKILNEYKRNAINTASQGELIIMLYEGAINAINEAEKKMHYSSYDIVNRQIKKAVNIIDELRASLDKKKGGDIAERLESIYIYMNEQLINANMDKNIEPLKEIRDLLNQLLSAWKEIVGSGAGKNAAADNKNKKADLNSGFSITG